MTTLTHLECSLCGRQHDAAKAQNRCPCGGALMARCDLELARRSWSREWINHGPATMWRYAPVLPVRKPSAIVSLGEGMTPLVRVERLGAQQLWIKDEGLNPTGTFKARGLACAVSMAVELGIRKLAIASAGNAAAALAAYAAAAGLEAHIFMPRDASPANYIQGQAFGARVTQVDGLIDDCSRLLAGRAPTEGWFNVGAFEEPYQVEGTKTIGYEIAEQFNWDMPDAIVCPVGDGVGLVGIWKAIEELEALGWIAGRRPRMIAVQAWEKATTIAAGIRVPKPAGEALISQTLRASGGTAVAVSDAEMLEAGLELASLQGIFVAPEGAACLAALRKLPLGPDERVVLLNTGSGLKYLEAYSTRFARHHAGEPDKLGGLITPR
ncbi:MAG: threonine synthase [Acidobacteriota bacterium]